MFRKLTLHCLFSLAVAVALGSQTVQAASPDSDVLFIFDASASMSRKTLKGKRKIDVAKAAFVRMVNKLPESGNVKVGLMAYGHRIAAGRPQCCRDIELVVPVNATNRELLSAKVRNFRPRGKTPIARSLLLAGATLRQLQTDRQKVIVLLTDGIETCGGDPRQAAATLRKLGMKVDFYVIGFDLAARQVKSIKAIAEAGGGTFLNAKDSEKLEKAFEVVVEKAIQKKPAMPKRRAKAYFFDDFNGEGLADHWKVENRDDDAHIAENGALTLVANTPGSLEKGTVTNLLRLNKPLPDGDWTMTMQVRTRIQTEYESMVFGLHQDKQNYVVATATFYKYVYRGICDIAAMKMVKGKKSVVGKTIYDNSGSTSTVAERFKSFPQPLLLRLEKRGRGYTVSYGFEYEDKKTKKKQLKWTSVGKLTSLRAKGQLVLGFHQREKVAGESSINVDWVRIDRNE